MAWVAIFAISWLIWYLLADKKRWLEISPTAYFAALLGATTDIIVHDLPLWEYSMEPWSEIVNNYSVYIVVTYLYIQYLPSKCTFKNMFVYVLLWTSIGVAIEYLYYRLGLIKYREGWSIYISYAADWGLYLIFYGHYRFRQWLRTKNQVN